MPHDMVKLPDWLNSQFAPAKLELIHTVIRSLTNQPHFEGLFIGGSATYKPCDEYSDLDLFCVVATGCSVPANAAIGEMARGLTGIAGILDGQRYPWFGQLTTILWREPLLFSLDVGVIESDEVTTFFVEPQADIILDKHGRIEARRRETRQAEGARRAAYVDAQVRTAVLLVPKIRKALYRGHKWNALEYVSQLRRCLVAFLRMEGIGGEHPMLGRPERDIEDLAGHDWLETLSTTLPLYTEKSIQISTISLLDLILARRAVIENQQMFILLKWEREIVASENYPSREHGA